MSRETELLEHVAEVTERYLSGVASRLELRLLRDRVWARLDELRPALPSLDVDDEVDIYP